MTPQKISTLVEDEVRQEIFLPFIQNAKGGETIVEIGVFVGGNVCRIAEMIKNSNKNIQLFGIDDFHFVNISDTGLAQTNLKKYNTYDTRQESYFNTCINNINQCGLTNSITIIDGDSIESSVLFDDSSIDLLFIDGNHSEQYFEKELIAWLPKVKNIISGHDWPSQGIQNAIKKTFRDKNINITSTDGGYWIKLDESLKPNNTIRTTEYYQYIKEKDTRDMKYISDIFDNGYIYEFGVYGGATLQKIIEQCRNCNKSVKMFVGFDSFQGLPKPRNNEHVANGWYEGNFNASALLKTDVETSKNFILSELKQLTDNVMLVPGFYKDSLNQKLATKFHFGPASYVHVDVDLYSSCVEVLEFLIQNNLLTEGSIIVYDDWNIMYQEEYKSGESLAHKEVFDRYNIKTHKLLTEKTTNRYRTLINTMGKITLNEKIAGKPRHGNNCFRVSKINNII